MPKFSRELREINRLKAKLNELEIENRLLKENVNSLTSFNLNLENKYQDMKQTYCMLIDRQDKIIEQYKMNN